MYKGWHKIFLLLYLTSFTHVHTAVFKMVTKRLPFTKRLFSFSLISATKIMSPVYLRLLTFLLTILILACALFSLAFHLMYSV